MYVDSKKNFRVATIELSEVNKINKKNAQYWTIKIGCTFFVVHKHKIHLDNGQKKLSGVF